MTDEIVKALPEWFVHRMRAWAQFRISSGAYSVPSSWPSDGPMNDRGGTFGPRYYRLLGSVHETQVEIDKLPARHRQAVQQYWVLEPYGFSLREHARRRQITHPTFIAWLRRGHVLLAVGFRHLRDQKRAAEELRERQGAVRGIDKANLPIYHSAH